MRIDNNGYVGIGLTSPSALLSLAGSSTARASMNIAAGTAPSAPNAGDIYADGTDIFYRTAAGAWVDLTVQGGASLFTDGGATTYLGSGGVAGTDFVGIGTTSANSLLELYSATADTYLTVNNGSTYDAGLAFRLGGTAPLYTMGIDNSDGDKFKISGSGALGTNDLFVLDSTNSSVSMGSGATSMSIDANGKVGIGTTAPGYLLDVYTDAASSYAANFMNDGNNANRYGVRVQAGADDASGTTYFLNAYDGDGTNVGYLAEVSGTFGVTNVSDVSTKTNIASTNLSGVSIIGGLRVVDYNRIQNPTGPTIHGFIAQEVQQVYPEMVTTGPDGKLGLMTDQLMPVVVKAVQEQQGQITAITNDQLSITNQLSSSNDQISKLNDKTISVDDKINIIGATLSDISVQTQNIASLQTADETRIKSLEDDMALLKEQNKAIIDFAKAIQADKLVYKDELGNVNILGGALQADSVVAGAFAVKVTDESSRTVGTEAIHIYTDENLDGIDDNFPGNDGKSIEVKTTAVTGTSKIFVTPEGDAGGSVWVEKEADSNGSYKGFVIKCSSPVKADVKVDWFIVEEK
jgi:hypothetical protein